AWAVRHHRPRPARPWWLLTAGLGLLAMGDVVFNALTRLNGHEVFPSPADGFYLASYVVLSWGVASMLRARRRGRDRTALHDATLVTVVATVVTWVYLVDPSAYGGVPLVEAVISAAYPVGDIALLAFLVRLLLGSSRRLPAERILAVGIALLLLADVAYARLALTGSYSVGGWLDLVYHLSYLCLPVAAAHPGMGRMVAPEEDFAPSGRSRRGLVMGFSLVLPVMATLEVIDGHRHHAVLLAAASTAVFFLLTLRTGVLNASLADVLAREQDALDRERVLRAMGMALVGATDREVIAAAVVHHARLLAGPGAEAVVALGEPGAWRVVTAGHSLRLPAGALLDGVPSDVETALQAGRATVVAPGAALGFGAALSEAIALRPLVLAPLVVGGRLAGAVVVAPRHRAGGAPRLLEACEALGSAASLALESAQLAERLLDERSEQRFGAMIRNSSDILLVLRADGTVRYLSPSATRILGWRAEDLHGRHVRDLVHPGDAAMIAGAFHRALTQAGTHGPIECRVLHRDGSWRFLEAVGTGLHDDPGLSGVVVNVRDVTDRVRLEDELSHQASASAAR
ncbi:MAG TPA: PAS domain S-box protein, partial [Acidimicrobiales bacterium]|nr:PAS domain S-box protein [Acidimicrobiales bacterium]